MANPYGDVIPSVIPTAPAQANMGTVNPNPFGSGGGPLQYFLAHGGNPVMSSQFLSYLSSLPPQLASQMTANPQMAMQAFVQGVRDPTQQGLTFSNGQWNDSTGNAYSSANDTAYQNQQAQQAQQWNTMYQNSPLYNNGGKMNINGNAVGGASNPYTVTPTSGNMGSMTVNQPQTATQPTGNGSLVRPVTPVPTTPAAPPPAPVAQQDPNTVAKTTPTTAVTGGAQYNQPAVDQQNAQNPAAQVNAYRTGGATVNPYQPQKNVYQLNNTKGWNI